MLAVLLLTASVHVWASIQASGQRCQDGIKLSWPIPRLATNKPRYAVWVCVGGNKSPFGRKGADDAALTPLIRQKLTDHVFVCVPVWIGEEAATAVGLSAVVVNIRLSLGNLSGSDFSAGNGVKGAQSARIQGGIADCRMGMVPAVIFDMDQPLVSGFLPPILA